MKIAFWIAFGVVLYTYAGYPLIMALLARLRPHHWLQGPFIRPVSLLMAVHNGEGMLPWKIDHLLALDPAVVKEIIFISDGSTDQTAHLLRSIKDPRARVLILPEQVGKASALNQGLALATGEILVFTDMRPRIRQGALLSLLSNFADPSVGCVAGELLVQCGSQHAATTSAVGGLYWRYEQAIRNCESLWDSPVGVYGGFYAIRRSLATMAPDGLILDDMFQPLSVIRQGFRSVVDRKAVVEDTWPASTRNEFARKVRTLAGNFQLFGLAPWTLSFQNRVLWQLVSHKLLRLIVPWMLLLMLGSSALLGVQPGLWSAVALVQGLVWLLAAAALRVRLPLIHRFVAPLSALLVLNAAAVQGLYTFLHTAGPLWKIWSPTAATAPSALAMHEEHEHA